MSEQNEQTTPTVQDEGKKKRVSKANVTVEGNVLTFAFAHGETVVLDAATLSAEIRNRAMLHGLEQKIRDSYAGSPTAQEAMGEALKVVDTISGKNGVPTWNAKSEGGEGATPTTLLAQAVVNAYAAKGKAFTLDEVKAQLEAMSKEDRATIRARESVAVELAKLRAAKATPKATPEAFGDL